MLNQNQRRLRLLSSTLTINQKLDVILQNIDALHALAEKSRAYKRLKALEA
jgi:NAD-dependent SIR2 family protein deacetylase